MVKFIEIPFEYTALHFWNDAPKEYEWLKSPHAHNFKSTITLEVTQVNRELSFEEVKDWLSTNVIPRFQSSVTEMSCEMMADWIMLRAIEKYRRFVQVRVSEDGGPAAIVSGDRL